MADGLTFDHIRRQLAGLDTARDDYATRFVEALLTLGPQLAASDLHVTPTPAGIEVRLRMDGVLQTVGTFPAGKTTDVAARLKVLADLLTYRTDVPQEERIREPGAAVEMRVSTFPTLHGEKVVVRLFAAAGRHQRLADLGLPPDVRDRLGRLLVETSGAILIVGPAGSGKTTTAYACLRELAERSAGVRSIATLEDPIEVALTGVAQSQVNERAGLDLASGLRSLLRQDPEVILLGEMRDPATARIAMQAALTGQLIVTTFHAGSAAAALSRLMDMGIEPYVLRSGVLAVLCQRLVRKLCCCATANNDPEARLGLPVTSVRDPRGCPACHGTGYSDRMVLAEMLTLDMEGVASGLLSRTDTAGLERAAAAHGMRTRWHSACDAVDAGSTSPREVRRVLGFSDAFPVDAE